jgi:Asp/Glu/hydantoin racemase
MNEGRAVQLKLGSAFNAVIREDKGTLTLEERGSSFGEMLKATLRTMEVHKSSAADMLVIGTALVECATRALDHDFGIPALAEVLAKKGQRYGQVMAEEMVKAAKQTDNNGSKQ